MGYGPDLLLQPVHDSADFLPIFGIVSCRLDAHLQGQQFVGDAVVQLLGQVCAFFLQPLGVASGGFPFFFFLHALQAAFGGFLLLTEMQQPEHSQEHDAERDHQDSQLGGFLLQQLFVEAGVLQFLFLGAVFDVQPRHFVGQLAAGQCVCPQAGTVHAGKGAVVVA